MVYTKFVLNAFKRGKMREIKFRAWDFDNCCMVTWEQHLKGMDERNDFYLISIETSEVIWNGDPNGYCEVRIPAIIEQYTGLKDKNGREIYEGDFIKVPLWESPLNYGPSINVGDDVIGVFWNEEMLMWGLKELDGKIANESLCDFDCSEIEIIGNIHENPELLEEK